MLVILGNPPYNGFAGMAPADDEERELSEAYRTTKQVRRPEGQGLNDLYVRFFRMAERRIAEKTGQGVVCFISNYSWLDGLSFTGMRERYLEAFDVVRIDNLNGDKYQDRQSTPPDGRTQRDQHLLHAKATRSPGIKVGTAIAHCWCASPTSSMQRRIPSASVTCDFHQARARRADGVSALLDSLESRTIDSDYATLEPDLQLSACPSSPNDGGRRLARLAGAVRSCSRRAFSWCEDKRGIRF